MTVVRASPRRVADVPRTKVSPNIRKSSQVTPPSAFIRSGPRNTISSSGEVSMSTSKKPAPMFNGFKPTRQNLSVRVSPSHAPNPKSSFKPPRPVDRRLKPSLPSHAATGRDPWHPKNTTIVKVSANENWLGRPQALPTRCREETLRRSRSRNKVGGMDLNQNDIRQQMMTPLVTDRGSRKKSTAVAVDF